jgi:hypothetical protein
VINEASQSNTYPGFMNGTYSSHQKQRANTLYLQDAIYYMQPIPMQENEEKMFAKLSLRTTQNEMDESTIASTRLPQDKQLETNFLLCGLGGV